MVHADQALPENNARLQLIRSHVRNASEGINTRRQHGSIQRKIGTHQRRNTGIGLATAKLFIEEGARVIVTGRTSATIKEAQAELGENAVVMHSDATSLPDMDALAKKVKGP